MSGPRIPGGEQRKANQRHSRRAGAAPVVIQPIWRPGDKVYWNGYTGAFLRNVEDGQAEILIGTRTYRVSRADLQPV
jgi:hypothetical protein